MFVGWVSSLMDVVLRSSACQPQADMTVLGKKGSSSKRSTSLNEGQGVILSEAKNLIILEE